MQNYRLTHAAEGDIAGIARYTASQWSEEQAIKYQEELFNCIEGLGNFPGMGQNVDYIAKGFHRFLQGRHWIYYKIEPDYIIVTRVLHQSMHQSKQVFTINLEDPIDLSSLW